MKNCLFLICYLLATISVFSQKKVTAGSPRIIQKVDSILHSQVERELIPGAIIQVKIGSNIVMSKAYGYANAYSFNGQLLDKPELMSKEHLFDIASLTKVVGTTTAIMLLVDKGQLSIDEPVGKYISDFTSPDKKDITIRHLLTHTSGLHDWYPMYFRSNNRQSTYKLIGSLPLKYPVGKERHYSDLGFTILGQIIETISGMPLEEFVDRNIFKPLGMKSSAYNPIKKGFIKFAATSHGNPYEKRMVFDSSLGYQFPDIIHESWNGWRQYTLRGEVNDGNAWYANGGVSGAAGLFSTVSDLQRVVDMLMNKGKVGSKQFLSEKTISTFLTKDRFLNGLGWMMDPANSFMKGAPEGSFGHTGFTGTSIAVIPSEKMSIILLTNRQNTGLNAKGDYYSLNGVRAEIFSLWR